MRLDFDTFRGHYAWGVRQTRMGGSSISPIGPLDQENAVEWQEGLGHQKYFVVLVVRYLNLADLIESCSRDD